MFYKLLIISFLSINIVNTVNATLNTNVNKDLSNFFTKDNLLNQNSSSLNSIASTNSNSSLNGRESIGEEDNNYYILQEDSNITLLSNSIDNNPKIQIKYDENYINKCFMENCDIENLDINSGKKHLLKLFNEFELMSESKNTKTPISKINNRFCLMISIAYGFIKVNKILKLNNKITDENINDIEDLSYNLYYENGLFTKDVLMKYFNVYKIKLVPLLYPLIDFYN